jgi:outer membrane protein OmpA-like peptidoglycan-associated protein
MRVVGGQQLKLIVEEKRMNSHALKSVSRILALLLMAAMPVALAAQDSAKPAAKASEYASASKWDIFMGYSYLSPHGDATASPGICGKCGNPTHYYDEQDVGGIFSATRFFNRYVGVQAEVGIHEYSGGAYGAGGNDDGFTTFAGGLILRDPGVKFTPFAHALVGGAEVSGPFHNPNTLGLDITAGGGLDYELNHHWAFRMIQADYEYMNVNFGTNSTGLLYNLHGSLGIDAMRLSGGIVYHSGDFTPPTPVTLSVSVNPTSIFPGDPVTATAVADNLNPKLDAIYVWTGTGVTGSGASATVATATLAPGSYMVQAQVKEGRPGKEGLKPWQSAEASASFTVKAFEPPSISCSTSPSTINVGGTSTVTAGGVSPQNRPLTYSYSASSGSISGSGATAEFNAADAPAGTVQITCNVSDDKGQSATATTSVSIAAPPAPIIPAIAAATPEMRRLEARLALHSVFFATAQPRIEKPDGGLLPSQAGTLATLATDFTQYLALKPDARLILSGHADVRGSVEYNQALSERRVARAKLFLIEKGVPEASIETRGLGKDQNLTADQVRDLVEQNPDLSAEAKARVVHNLSVIVLAQNRRVDVTLSNQGEKSEQSVRLYPFNAADSATLLDEKNLHPRKKAATKK